MMSRPYTLRGPLLFAVGLTLLIVGFLYWSPLSVRAATEPNTADVVVQFADGSIVTRHITFTGTISGLEALRLTGLDLVEKNGGVCRIGDTGCTADEDCFCGCPPPYTSCLYWSYERWNGTAWEASSLGAASTTVSDGAVEGWTWGRVLPSLTEPVLGAQAGLEWLRGYQNENGSYGGGSGSAGSTIDTLLANRALGGSADEWTSTADHSLVDALETLAPAYAANSAAAAGKLAVGVAAADRDPSDFAGLNLVISMTATLNTSTGAYGATNWDQAFAVLGMRASGAAIPTAAINLLKSRVNADGGWGYVAGGDSDVDSTGLVLQALAAAGVPASDAVVTGALAYLDTVQNSDGGFPYSTGYESNANSTALAVQGILASQSDPLAARWLPASTNPISYMLGLQLANGAFTYGGQANLLATQQVIPALAGRSFPFLSSATARRLALSYIASQQQTDGSFAGFGTGSTIDAILAIRAADGDPQSFVSGGKRPLDYLETQAASYAAASAAAGGKLLVGVVAAGGNPRDFAGLDLVINTTLRYNSATGAYGTTTYDQAWSILGLVAAGQTVPVSATEYLETIQATGGGWGYDVNATVADADSTGLALQALAAASSGTTDLASLSSALVCTSSAGISNPAVSAALSFLRSVANPDGGFPGYDGSTSPSSTGLALQGLAAYDETPRGLGWTSTVTDGTASALTLNNPLDALLALQTTAGGFPGYSGANDPSSTYQALPGLLGHPFPSTVRTIISMPMVWR